MPPGDRTTPFFSQAWGQPGTVIPLPDGGQIIVPATGFSQEEYDVLSGIRAGNPVGGPFAQAILDRLVQGGSLTPGSGGFYGSPGGQGGGPPGGSAELPGGDPRPYVPNEPRHPGTGGPAPQSGASRSGVAPPPGPAGGPSAGSPPPPMGGGTQRGQGPVYFQPRAPMPTAMPPPAYAQGLAQRLAAQRGGRVARPFAAPAPVAPQAPPFNPAPPSGAGGPRPRGPGWDINSPKPGGGSPPFYPGKPDSQLPTKPGGVTTTTKPYGSR